VPDLPTPEPPAEQLALRTTVEAVLRDYEGTASYSHNDRFWESDNRRQAVYGWGTTIVRQAAGGPIEVWFDGLDEDIAVWQARGGPWWRRRGGSNWHEWRDLTDLDSVLADVTRVLRTLLSDDR
jgi:hypothetical protein